MCKGYLMINRKDGPPFQFYVEYKSRAMMKEARMNFWHKGCGAKQVTKAEYEAWLGGIRGRGRRMGVLNSVVASWGRWLRRAKSLLRRLCR